MLIQNSGTWAGLTENKTGTSTINIVGKLVTFNSDGVSAASLEKKYIVKPGEVMTIRVFAKGVGRIKMNYPTAGAPKNQALIDSNSWQWYEISYLVPVTHIESSDFINVFIGQNNEDVGTLEVARWEIDSDMGGIPASRCVAAGRLKFLAASDTVEIVDDYVSFGIESITYDSGVNTSLITIQTDSTYPINNNYIPNVFGQHPGGQNNQYEPHVEMDRFGLGRIYIVFYDSAGTALDLTTLSTDIEVAFQAFL